jgi:maltose O-acetyltransferase
MQFFIALLPDNSLNRLRSVLYRIAGVSVGKGTVILGKLNIVGGGRPSVMFRIGENCLINSPLYAELNAPITIGSDVAIGHHVVLITTGHETSCAEHRAGAAKFAPIIIEDGAWVCSGVTILPGVTVGKGSVIAAGSVVPRSVLPNEMVGGVPGRLIKKLEG